MKKSPILLGQIRCMESVEDYLRMFKCSMTFRRNLSGNFSVRPDNETTLFQRRGEATVPAER
jgi:hypothetical protein